MNRIEYGAAILACALIALIGLYLALGSEGTMETFGWVIAVVGSGALTMNLFLRSRMR